MYIYNRLKDNLTSKPFKSNATWDEANFSK